MNFCSVWVNVKHSLFGGSSYNCRRQEAAWSGNWESDEGLKIFFLLAILKPISIVVLLFKFAYHVSDFF